MTRLDDTQLADLKVLAADSRLHAKHADALARADREKGDTVGARIWTLRARELRQAARDHDYAMQSERLWRRLDKSAALRASEDLKRRAS